MDEEEKILTKQLFTVNFNCNENFEKIKDTFGITLKEYLRGHEYNSVNVYTNDQEKTITVTYTESLAEDEVFQIDSTPCPVPIAYVRYETTKVMSAPVTPINDAAPLPLAKSSCFNCGNEGHSLKDCTQPRDGKRISKARQSMSKKAERYHLNADQKYDAYKPGVISDELRAALGIRSRELPIHIYKMRQYGYPPGWLDEAKVTESGLSMFTHHKSDAEEEGEEESAIYDPHKIIDFPGFNTCRGDFVDDSHRYDLPRMHPMHEKNFFISRLKRKSDKEKKIDDANVIEIDMDQSPKRSSPTLDDLRNEQKKLIEQLGISQAEKGETDKTIDDDTELEPLPDGFVVLDETFDSQSSPVPNGDCSLTTRSEALSVAEGTPILKSCSKFDRLPVGQEIWRAGVSEVIDFENLPNSTGKYEQMKGVLSKVRKRLHK